MNIISSFTKAEFSKKIFIIVLFIYVITYISMIISKLLWDIDLSKYFEYAQNTFLFYSGGYVVKTIPENITKIKTNSQTNSPV